MVRFDLKLIVYSLKIPHLYREFSSNSFSVSRVQIRFTICFVNKVWINFRYREFTIDSLSLSRILYLFTICFANSLSVHHFYLEFTTYSLSFSKRHNRSTIFIINYECTTVVGETGGSLFYNKIRTERWCSKSKK